MPAGLILPGAFGFLVGLALNSRYCAAGDNTKLAEDDLRGLDLTGVIGVTVITLGRRGVASVGDGGADDSSGVPGALSDSKIESLGSVGRVRKKTPKNVVMQP